MKKKQASLGDEGSAAGQTNQVPGLVARRAFSIHHGDFHLEIKVGDDLSKVPELYLENLRTEGVL